MGRMESGIRLARAMSFRTKLLAAFAVTVIVAVGSVSAIVAVTTRRAFERLDDERSKALVAQFRREYQRRQSDVMRGVERMAQSESLRRIALDSDYSSCLLYTSDAADERS